MTSGVPASILITSSGPNYLSQGKLEKSVPQQGGSGIAIVSLRYNTVDLLSDYSTV